MLNYSIILVLLNSNMISEVKGGKVSSEEKYIANNFNCYTIVNCSVV